MKKLFLLLVSFTQLLFANVEILKDNNYEIRDVLEKPFHKVSSKNLERVGTYWVKVDVSQEKERFFALNFARTLQIQKHFILKEGLLEPNNNNFFRVKNWSYYYFYDEHEPSTLFFKVSSNSWKKIDLDILHTDLQKYEKFAELTNSLDMFYIGILLSFIFYNLVMYYNTRSKLYLHYSFFQITILITLFYTLGIDQKFYISQNLREYFPFEVMPFLALIASIFFTREFFETKKYHTLIDKILAYSVYGFLVYMILGVVYPAFNYQNFPFTAFILIYIYLTIKAFLRGHTQVKLYVLGFSAFVGSIFLRDVGMALGKDLTFDDNLILLGHIIETIFFTFAITSKVKEMVEELNTQKELLVQQHKLSMLGNLLGYITHQWKEPLNRINSYIMNVQFNYGHEEKEKVLTKLSGAQEQVSFMGKILEDFKNFYSPNQQKEEFTPYKTILYILDLTKSNFLVEHVNVEVIEHEKLSLIGNENEFAQVVLILLNNAKDAFKSRGIENKNVKVEVFKEKITVTDNAGGITKTMLPTLFDAHKSSKSDGMGIGLYMSRVIIEEKFAGIIEVKNTQDGACFTLSF